MELKTVLAGKKILLIGVNFYHYNREIIRELQDNGADVTFFFERDISYRYAVVDSFFPSFLERFQDLHYSRILRKTRGKSFDYLLVIRANRMKGWFPEEIKRRNPAIKTIMYQWDSIDNWNSDYRYLMPFFEKIYTFDYRDSRKLNIPYVPTFFTKEFTSLPSVEKKIDLFYFGNYTAERYRALLLLLDFARENGLTIKTHIGISRWRYFREKSRGIDLRPGFLKFTRMDKQEYISLFNQSRVIVDVITNTQSGMTMRVIDALGAGKQVITTNSYVREEPGYDPAQIAVFSLDHIEIPPGFIREEPFQKRDYSITTWLKRLFGVD